MKKAVGILVCLLALVLCAGALADVAIDETNFPDANFRNVILNSGFDKDGNSALSDSEIAAVTEINCRSKSIQDLKGIEHFTALTYLNCTYNQLTSLDVSKSTALTSLSCGNNQLTTLNVSGCPLVISVLNSDREDKDTYWLYDDGHWNVKIDKTVEVILEGEDDTDPTDDTTVTSVTVKGVKYKLSGSTATAIGPEKKTAKTITIQATVSANNKTYKVTAIKAKAFQKMTKLTKVTIGKNVKSIGKNAFYNCKKLKTIDIKTTKLTSGKVGTNAFKGIYKKATITCPSSKKAAYKKWLTKKGVPKTAKIK